MSSAALVIVESEELKKKKSVREKMSYTWVIENIDSCFKDTVNTLKSPTCYNEVRDCEWQIKLRFPRKGVRGDEDYLLAYLSAIQVPNDAVDVEITLSVRDSEDNDIVTGTYGPAFNKRCNSWGFENIILMFKLPSEMRDKILKILADVLIPVFRLEKKGQVMVSRFSEARLQKSMDELFESSLFTDVVFEVKGAELKAHKCVLSARSLVFAAMFTHDSIEKRSGVVKIVDFESDIFRRFLHFVYSGRVSISSVDIAIELVRAAEKYDFPDLKLLCMKYMSTNLSSSNVGSILLLADIYCDDDLKQTVMNYMVENIRNFCDVEMEVYKLLEKEKPTLLTEFLVLSSKNLLKKIPS